MTNPWEGVYAHPVCSGRAGQVPPFPLYLDVEVTNVCNMRCVFCVRAQMRRPQGFMPLERFSRLCASARSCGCRGVRLIRWGEPLLHPDIHRLVQCAKEHGLLTHVTTNGLLLGRRMFLKLVAAGLDSLIVSLQGTTRAEYASIRAADAYPLVRRHVREAAHMRAALRVRRPFLQVNTTITDESPAEVERFRRRWADCADRVAVGYTWFRRLRDTAGLGDLLKRGRRLPRRFRCFEVLCKMSVDWDGAVTACCLDYDRKMTIGHCDKDDLLALWRSRRLAHIRRLASSGQLEKLSFCSSCELNYPFRGEALEGTC